MKRVVTHEAARTLGISNGCLDPLRAVKRVSRALSDAGNAVRALCFLLCLLISAAALTMESALFGIRTGH